MIEDEVRFLHFGTAEEFGAVQVQPKKAASTRISQVQRHWFLALHVKEA